MTVVQTHLESELTDEQIESIVTLTNSIWPKEELSLEQRIESAQKEFRLPERQEIRPQRFVVWEGPKAIAHALIFHREIYFEDSVVEKLGTENVLALAGVCTEVSRRGLGLGAMVVQEAFKHVGNDAPVCLFQTGVPEFYEKLGGRVVTNKFINRQNEISPEENPWWDSVVMIYPSRFRWPGETVDLNGAGY